MPVQQLLKINGGGAASTQTSPVQTVTSPAGGGPIVLTVVFDLTQLTGTSVILSVQGVDSVSGKTFQLGATAVYTALSAAGTQVYQFGAGIITGDTGGAGNGVTKGVGIGVPSQIQVVVTPTAVTTAVYTVSAHWN